MCLFIQMALDTVTAEIKAAPQKFVIPKEKALLCLICFGITHFWGAASIWEFTVFCILQEVISKFFQKSFLWKFNTMQCLETLEY